MSGRELYEGHALQAVDDKGRVALPADLRAAFDRNSDVRTIMVGKHPRENCLIAHDVDWSQIKGARVMARLEAKLDAGEDIDDSKVRRSMHGRLDRANLDGSARFILTPYYKERAGITKWAFFVGTGTEMEIWAPEVLVNSDNVDEELRDICRWCCEQRGVAL